MLINQYRKAEEERRSVVRGFGLWALAIATIRLRREVSRRYHQGRLNQYRVNEIKRLNSNRKETTFLNGNRKCITESKIAFKRFREKTLQSFCFFGK